MPLNSQKSFYIQEFIKKQIFSETRKKTIMLQIYSNFQNYIFTYIFYLFVYL